MVETWQEDLIRSGTLKKESLETIYGSATLSDRDYAFDFLASSKFSVSAVARALTETANPQLRQLLINELSASIQEHFRLADLATAKGWYKPHATPEQQLAADVAAIRQAMGGGQSFMSAT